MTVEFEGQSVTLYVTKRPFLDEFLEAMADKFEIGIFTASLQEYAEKVVQQIDPESRIKWRLCRDSCSTHKGYTVKNLELVPRSLPRTIIIDDKEVSFMLQHYNGIQCVPFGGGPDDTVRNFGSFQSSVEVREYKE